MVDVKAKNVDAEGRATPEYMDEFHGEIAEKFNIKYGVVTNASLDKKVEHDFKDLAARALLRGNCNHGDPYTHDEIKYLIGNATPVSQEFNPIPEAYVTATDSRRLVGSGFLHLEVGNHKNGFLFGVYEDPAYKNKNVEQGILYRVLQHAREIGIRKITALVPKFPEKERLYAEHRFTLIETSNNRFLQLGGIRAIVNAVQAAYHAGKYGTIQGEGLYHKMQLRL